MLPGTNCAECGVKTCMGFAAELVEKRKKVDDCPAILKPEYEKERENLTKLLTPPVKPIIIGRGDKAIRIGGEEVMYRHERTWYNPFAMIVDVDDRMEEDGLVDRVKWITSYSRIKIGQKISLDGIAVRSRSGDPATFGNAVRLAAENTVYPLVLCTYRPHVMESGLKALDDGNPLLYAATRDNWQEITDLAISYGCPLTICSSDLQEMVELSTRALDRGVGDDQIVLDPVTDALDLESTLGRIALIRRAAIEDEFEPLRFPVLGTPANAWEVEENENDASFMEGTISCALAINAVDAMIYHSVDVWSLMPSMVLRQDIYQDPRNPASIEAELREVGHPDENSPILITANFALTYFTVEADCEGVDCYIYPVDTDGTSVTSAVAGELMTAEKIVDAMKKLKFGEKVRHKTIIIPGEAAVLSGQIELDSGWRVLVGPKDSSGIRDFLSDNWPPKDSPSDE